MTLSKRLQHHCRGAENENAVAGVGSRNGAKQRVTTKKPKGDCKAPSPALTSRLVALIDRDGTVTGLFHRPDDVRAFLQGGAAHG